MAQGLSRDLLKWVLGLDLSFSVKNVKRDFSNGFLVAQILNRYYPDDISMHSFENVNSTAKKMANWHLLEKLMRKKGLLITSREIDAIIQAEEEAALKLLDRLHKALGGTQRPLAAEADREGLGGPGASELNVTDSPSVPRGRAGSVPHQRDAGAAPSSSGPGGGGYSAAARGAARGAGSASGPATPTSSGHGGHGHGHGQAHGRSRGASAAPEPGYGVSDEAAAAQAYWQQAAVAAGYPPEYWQQVAAQYGYAADPSGGAGGAADPYGMQHMYGAGGGGGGAYGWDAQSYAAAAAAAGYPMDPSMFHQAGGGWDSAAQAAYYAQYGAAAAAADPAAAAAFYFGDGVGAGAAEANYYYYNGEGGAPAGSVAEAEVLEAKKRLAKAAKDRAAREKEAAEAASAPPREYRGDYKPHTLQDYKEKFTKDYVQLGRLGPDLDPAIGLKRERLEKMKQYGKAAPKPAVNPKPVVKPKEPNPRDKAIAYAKLVPKPVVAPQAKASPSAPEGGGGTPRDARDTPASGPASQAPYGALSAADQEARLAELEARHWEDVRKVQLILADLAIKASEPRPEDSFGGGIGGEASVGLGIGLGGGISMMMEGEFEGVEGGEDSLLGIEASEA